ncbi:MAG TPA: T9SS type A sorting domain-containing protein [Chitinophagaceae bacterium]
MRKNFLVLFCLCFFLTAKSQSPDPSIISAAGGSDKTSTISLDWTMGEYAVETITSASKMYTQGFHQPLLIETITTARTASDADNYTISIAPNPIISIVNFGIVSTKAGRVFITISDVNGLIFIQKNIAINSGNIQIDMSSLRAGTYMLTVRDGVAANVIKSYRIIKAQ